MDKERFIQVVQSIVIKMLEKMNFFTHEWQLGKIAVVHADNYVDVYINGNDVTTPNVPANPDVTFNVNDYVWVHYVNRNPNNVYIPYKRNIRT